MRISEMDTSDAKVAIKVGGAVLTNSECSDLEFLFSEKKLWQEESSSEVHLLKFNVENQVFDWKLINVEGLEPRAFHSTLFVDRFLYIFGGLDVKNNKRFSILPIRININDWSVSSVVAEGFSGFLSGAGCLPCADKAFLVGGYTQQVAGKKEDMPSDIITQISFSSQGEIHQYIFSCDSSSGSVL